MTNKTINKDYTDRLLNKQNVWWKRLFDVQRPYRNNINNLNLGFVLDIGCGIGRNLEHLNKVGIGIDHNLDSVNVCRKKGIKAYTNDEFKKTNYYKENSFDSILLAHVAEHMTENEAYKLLKEFLPLLKDEGKVVIITPQEAGYKSDKTHIQFVDFGVVEKIFTKLDLKPVKYYSFPFPRFVGKFFKYNEFVSVAKKI